MRTALLVLSLSPRPRRALHGGDADRGVDRHLPGALRGRRREASGSTTTTRVRSRTACSRSRSTRPRPRTRPTASRRTATSPFLGMILDYPAERHDRDPPGGPREVARGRQHGNDPVHRERRGRVRLPRRRVPGRRSRTAHFWTRSTRPARPTGTTRSRPRATSPRSARSRACRPPARPSTVPVTLVPRATPTAIGGDRGALPRPLPGRRGHGRVRRRQRGRDPERRPLRPGLRDRHAGTRPST